jgi:hypothetical protein
METFLASPLSVHNPASHQHRGAGVVVVVDVVANREDERAANQQAKTRGAPGIA